MKPEKLYMHLASLVLARANCIASKNEWGERHEARILKLVKEHMPSGAGFDSGTTIDLDASTEDKLVFHTSYHHMDQNGFYAGWTEHVVTVRPSLVFGIVLTISGRNRNEIKDYIYESFHYPLTCLVDEAGKLTDPNAPATRIAQG